MSLRGWGKGDSGYPPPVSFVGGAHTEKKRLLPSRVQQSWSGTGLVANTSRSSWERAVVVLLLPSAWNSSLMWLFQAPADAASGFQFLGLCSRSHGVCTPRRTVVKVRFTSTVFTFWTQSLGSAMYFGMWCFISALLGTIMTLVLWVFIACSLEACGFQPQKCLRREVLLRPDIKKPWARVYSPDLEYMEQAVKLRTRYVGREKYQIEEKRSGKDNVYI